jgi:hypothetical protein
MRSATREGAGVSESVKHLTTTGLFPCRESDIVHVPRFSGGAGSWAAAKLVAASVPAKQIKLLFADTIIEDQDTYRMVIEGAANIFGLPRPGSLIERALSLPELSIDDPHCTERKSLLLSLREDAEKAIPSLIWIADGRHPWEVFGDVRFIGNSKTDPCSLILKRALMDDWRDTNCHVDSSIMYVGIDATERHRFDRMLPLVAPWRYEAPLCSARIWKSRAIEWLTDEGIALPRAYALGFPHNNCGGFCVKAGHAHFALLLRVWPQRYAWHEWWEEKMREVVGDYSMLADRRGDGKKKVLTLRMLRKRIEAGECFGQEEWGGCGCALAS